MSRICKFCFGDKFTHHENLEIFNPDTDEYEIISNVDKCDDCEAVYFETDTHYITQYSKHTDNIETKTTPKLGEYMNSK
jgi:hypothetical protein